MADVDIVDDVGEWGQPGKTYPVVGTDKPTVEIVDDIGEMGPIGQSYLAEAPGLQPAAAEAAEKPEQPRLAVSGILGEVQGDPDVMVVDELGEIGETGAEYQPNHPWLAGALRTGMPLASGLIGSAVGPAGTAVMGGIGAGVGESLAEKVEGREQSPPEIGFETVAGAIPLPGVKQGVGIAKRMVVRGAEMAGFGGATEAGRELIRGEQLDPGRIAESGLIGGVTGSVVGGVEGKILARAQSKPAYLSSPEAQRVRDRISVGESAPKSGIDLDAAYTAAVDDLHPIKTATDELLELRTERGGSGKVSAARDPYVNARLSRGTAGRAEAFIFGDTFLPNAPNESVSPGLKRVLDPIANRAEDFRVYGTARRAVERWRKGLETGINPADAEAAVAHLDSPEFQKAFQGLQDFRAAQLGYLQQSGILSANDADKILTESTEYLPFNRIMENDAGPGAPARFANLFNPLKRFKGSKREIIDPIESLVRNTFSQIAIADRNRVGLALADLAKSAGPDAADIMERIKTPIIPVANIREEMKRALRKITTLGAGRKITRTGTTTTTTTSTTTAPGAPAAAAGEVKAPNPKLVARVKEALLARGFAEGEADQMLARISTGGGAAMDSTTEEVKRVVDEVVEELDAEAAIDALPDSLLIAMRPSKVVPKDGSTIMVMRDGKPELYRVRPDLYNAMLNLDRESIGIVAKILAKPASLLRAGATLAPEFSARNPVRDQFSAWLQTRFGYRPFYDFGRGMSSLLRRDDFWEGFMRSGAAQSNIVSMDRDYVQGILRKVIPEQRGIVPNVVKHPIQALRALSEAGEQATRIGEFRRGIEKGASIEQAGMASREVTVDFARRGAKTAAVNAITAFWNARLQGTDRLGREIAAHPGKVAIKATAGLALPSVLLWAANHDDPRYKELPQWQKDLFWIVPVGDTLMRIPKPAGPAGLVFASGIERFLDYAETQDPEYIKQWAESLLQEFPTPELPTALRPGVEAYANRSTFTGRPLVPRGLEDVEPRYQATPFTSKTARAIGGLVNYSPAKIDNLIRGYGGGLGQLAVSGLDLFQGGPPAPEGELADVPGVRGFIARYPTGQAESINRFWERYGESAEAKSTFDMLRKKNPNEAAAYREKNQDKLREAGKLERQAAVLRALSKQQARIRDDQGMSAKSKRAQINALIEQSIQRAQQYLGQP